jgi:subtilisin-like proprotein convertase family protein
LSKPLLTWPRFLRLRTHLLGVQLLGAHLLGVQLCSAIIACILTIAATAPLHADPQGDLYFLSQNTTTNNLYRIDPSDLTATVAIGTTSTAGYGGLAPSPIHQHLYAAGQDCCNGIRLHAIDDSNNVMVFGDDNLNYYGMAYDPVGDILYASRDSSFVSIDHSGVVTALPLPPSTSSLHGMAWGGDGVFALDYGSNQELWFFDPQTEEWSSRGSTGLTWYQVGLAYRPDLDVLYAVRGGGYYTLHEINPTTAETVEIGNIGISTSGGGLAWVPADCNDNGVIDTDDLAKGTSLDCNGNSVPDECEDDCDENGIPDECDISGGAADCNGDGTLDSCEPDCDGNGVVDECEIAGGFADDCDGNGIPDPCDLDCDGNGVVDECEIAGGFADDCDGNGIPDPCDLDCDGNGLVDSCEVSGGFQTDCDGNGLIDPCEPDCNADGIADICQIETRYSTFEPIPIEYSNTYTDTITITDPGTVLDFDVYVDFEHSYGGVFEIFLDLPSGNAVLLHANYAGNNGPHGDDYFPRWYDSIANGTSDTPFAYENLLNQLGTVAAGEYTLRIVVNGGGTYENQWRGWGLRIRTETAALADCDADTIPDVCEEDCDGNGVPDECERDSYYLVETVRPLMPTGTSPIGIVTEEIQIDTPGRVRDVQVYFKGYLYVQNILTLTSPSGRTVMIDQNEALGETLFYYHSRVDLDRFQNNWKQPWQPLANFAGEEAQGTWILSFETTGTSYPNYWTESQLMIEVDGGLSDCDGNGVADPCDIAAGAVDTDGDGILDRCEIVNQVAQVRSVYGEWLYTPYGEYSNALELTGPGVVEDVDLTVDLRNEQYVYYLTGTLTSPSGTSVSWSYNPENESTYYTQGLTYSDDPAYKIYQVNEFSNFEGEPIAGEWSLQLDTLGNAQMWLQNWSLDFLRSQTAEDDCDASGVVDAEEIAQGLVFDCNGNAVPDHCDVQTRFASRLHSPLAFQYSHDYFAYQNSVGHRIRVPAGAHIQDLNIELEVEFEDARFEAWLTSPSGTQQQIYWNDSTGNPGLLDVILSDGEDFEAGTTSPHNSLSVFDEEDPAGDWMLTLFSQYNGTPQGFECYLHHWAIVLGETCGATGAVDCNCNGIPDECDIASGFGADCDGNGVLDECDYASGALDCNGNNLIDVCDIASGVSTDCDGNGVPDECQLNSGTDLDCNLNGILDACDIASGYSTDCDSNNIPDDCDLQNPASVIENSYIASTGIGYGSGAVFEQYFVIADDVIADDIDFLLNLTVSNMTQISVDLIDPSGATVRLYDGGGTGNSSIHITYDDEGVPEGSVPYNSGSATHMQPSGPGTLSDLASLAGEWTVRITAASASGTLNGSYLQASQFIDPDCNLNQVLDVCEMEVFFSAVDCNGNGVPDECDIFSGEAIDCDGSGIIDACELTANPRVAGSIAPEVPISAVTGPTESTLLMLEGTFIEDLDVQVDLSHSWVSDLTIELQHHGTTVTLFDGHGGDGDDLAGTVFDDQSLLSISEGVAPYSGQFRPLEPLSAFDDLPMVGEWTLRIEDSGPLDDGILHSWGIDGLPRYENDCNQNGILDRCESDCDGNGVPDECDVNGISGQIEGMLGPSIYYGPSYNPLTVYIPFTGGTANLADLNLYYNMCCSNYSTEWTLTSPEGTTISFTGFAYSPSSGTYEFSDACNDGSNVHGCGALPQLGLFEGEDPRGIWIVTLDNPFENLLLYDLGIRFIGDSGGDCNGNSVPDGCEIDAGTAFDCNGNGILDECDVVAGTALDCNGNGIDDACEYGSATDCNGNGILDECDVLNGIEGDCNGDGLLDSCEVAAGASDCDGNQIPDDCQPDCDGNGTADPCDITSGAGDCDGDGVLDSCESDCNANGTPDDCDIASGTSEDCDDNGVPDECQLFEGFVDCDGNGLIDVCQLFVEPDLDCDGNGAIDICELLDGTASDCDGNGIIDPCDILAGVGDCDFDGVPDPCEPEDCDGDGVPDACAIATGLVPDCDGDELPDSCSISQGAASDCDGNGVPDICTLLAGLDTDCDYDGVLDSCAIASGTPDCDGDAVPDACAISAGTVFDCNGNDIPDSCDIAAGSATDADGDGVPDLCGGSLFLRAECNGDGTISIADPVFLLDYLFSGGTAPGCSDGCDGNDDGGIDLSDVVFSLDYLFSGGAPPPPPWPQCGPDPSDDSLNCATAPDCL